MPFGIERINVRTAQPNPNINFIKPLENAHQALAQDFLERVAAICVPIMKHNHIYVGSLQEFPYNTEFLGRNFNGGEVIQLVLKNKHGVWLPFKFVQRVMMHELAHCKQMNHSKAFWQVNNQHCAELKALWDTGYTGEGMWSEGRLLQTGTCVRDRPLMEGDMPQHLCGGTFKRNMKRKRGAAPEKEKLSYQERQQRRIAKKFGTNGVALGADDEVKAKLEKGKRPVGRPRVAKSARGRELRAAAALARFDQTPVASGSGDFDGSDTESDEDDVKIKPDDAKDFNGTRLVDSHGRGMIKVCEDDHDGDADAQREMEELRSLEYVYGKSANLKTVFPAAAPISNTDPWMHNRANSYTRIYSVSENNGAPSSFGYREYSKNLRDAEKEKEFKNEALRLKSYGNASETMGFREFSKGLRDAEKEKQTKPQNLPRETYRSPYETAKFPNSKNTNIDIVKREVFDILSDYLGDETCNPGGAIYPGLEAAKAARPKKKPQLEEENEEDDEEQTEEETSAMDGFGLGSMPQNRTNSSSGTKPYSMGNSLAKPVEKATIGGKRHSQGFAHAVDKLRRENAVIGRVDDSDEAELEREQQRQANLLGGISPITTGLVGDIRRKSSQPSFASVADVSNKTQLPPSSQRTASHGLPTPPASSQPQRPPAPSSSQVPRPTPRATPVARAPAPAPAPRPAPPPPAPPGPTACKVCTTINDAGALTCMVCSNVLHPDRDPHHWKCASAACKDGEYINSGDYGICGVCGEKKKK